MTEEISTSVSSYNKETTYSEYYDSKGLCYSKSMTIYPLVEGGDVYIIRESISGDLENKPELGSDWKQEEYGNEDGKFSFCKKYATTTNPKSQNILEKLKG